MWHFDDFDLVGDGLACREVIEGKRAKTLRQQLAKIK